MIQYFNYNQKVNKGNLHLIALSGGCDSVVLFHLLKSEGFKLHVVHCNFQLRGEESDRDMHFCQTLCQEWNTPLTIKMFDTESYAKEHHVGIEMAARELRYNAFEELRKEFNADKVFVGTHADDVIETLFINMLRSTGIEGLTGIAWERNNIVRPLLDFYKTDILEYAEVHQLSYITDSSNNDEQILRNALRHRLIPTLQDIAPHSKASLLNVARNLNEVVPLLHQATADAIRQVLDGNRIDLQLLGKQPSQEWILYNILHPYGFSPKACWQIFDNLDAQQGKSWLSATHQLLKHQDSLLIFPLEEQPPVSLRIDKPGIYRITGSLTISIESAIVNSDFRIPKEPNFIAIDAADIHFPLTIQTVSDGMRFSPMGLKGSKLINDYLSEHAVPLAARHKSLVLTDQNNCVLWLVGHTIDHHFRIKADTKEVLLCQFQVEKD